MALPILDGNQSATTLSTIVTGGAHVPAHTIVSLGAQAITDIATAVASSSVTISGGVYISDAQVALGNNAPPEAVQIGGYNVADNKLYPIAVDNNGVQSISGTVTANGFYFNPDSHAVAAEVGYCGSLRDGEGNIFGLDRDFPIYGTVTASISNAQAELGENAPSQAVQIGGYNPADNKIYPFNVDSDGIQKVEARPLQSSSASITTFTETTSSTILAASATRKGIVFFVSGSGSAFISLGDVVTSTSAYSIVLSENDVANITGYTGDITGLVTGSTVLHVTSLS